MGQLRKETFICLDCESTGLSVETDEIIELAIIKFTFDELLEQFSSLVDPGIPIPPDSTKIHHITDSMIVGQPKIETLLPTAFELIGDHVIVGHNIGYDINMLIQAAKKRNIPCPLKIENSIDTLRLARLYAESPTNSLETLRKHFNIPEEGAHRALNDVTVNIQVFKYLTKEFRTTREIFDRLSRPIAMKLMPLGKHKGKPFRELPFDYLRWASNQDFDQDLLFSINEERNRRRKQTPFAASHNPFADL